MSWDVIVFRTETNAEASLELVERVLPLDNREIRKWFAENYPENTFANGECLLIEQAHFSIELLLDTGDTSESVMLLVRGGGDPYGIIEAFCQAFDCRAVDCGSGEWVEKADGSFERWQDYRDKVLKDN